MNLNITIQTPNGISRLTNHGNTSFVVLTIIDVTGNVFTSKALPAPIYSSVLTILPKPDGLECFVEIAFSNDETIQNSVKWEIIGLIPVFQIIENLIIGIE